jgi:hypothetical protein
LLRLPGGPAAQPATGAKSIPIERGVAVCFSCDADRYRLLASWAGLVASIDTTADLSCLVLNHHFRNDWQPRDDRSRCHRPTLREGDGDDQCRWTAFVHAVGSLSATTSAIRQVSRLLFGRGADGRALLPSLRGITEASSEWPAVKEAERICRGAAPLYAFRPEAIDVYQTTDHCRNGRRHDWRLILFEEPPTDPHQPARATPAAASARLIDRCQAFFAQRKIQLQCAALVTPDGRVRDLIGTPAGATRTIFARVDEIATMQATS